MPEYVVILVRSIISFFILFIVARALGKQQISQLTFFDYVAGIAIGNMAAAVSIDPSIEFINSIIALTVYTSFTIIIAYGALKSFKFRELVQSSPSILIRDGKVLEKNLFKNRITFDDLMTGLREKNAFKLADVELAVLETNGQISVMKKSENRPLTPKDLGIHIEEEHTPSLLIIDGHLLEKRMTHLGYTKEWLLGEIREKGANDFKDVFLGQIDSNGNIYIDLYNDEISTQQDEQKPLLAAKLRKIQAELEDYSLQTNDPNAKQMYYNQSKELKTMIERINPYLK